MNYNKYIHRAMRLKTLPDASLAEKVVSAAGTGLNKAVRYSDNLLGVRAGQFKVRADLAGSIAKNSPSIANKKRARIMANKAKDLKAASNKTRLKTVGAVAAAGVAHKVLKNNNNYSAYQSPSYYSQY